MSTINYQKMMQMLKIEKYKEIANYDTVVNMGIQAIWDKLCANISTPDIDPTDIYAEEMESLRDLEYSMKLMNICCLGETWEQDLYNFLKEKGLITVFSNDYGYTKKIFEENFPTCPISNYHEIIEMRALINAIKHGEGRALTNIRRLTSDAILADSNLSEEDENGNIITRKQIEFDGNTLTSRTLNVDGKLKEYSNAIITFWENVYIAERERLESPTM